MKKTTVNKFFAWTIIIALFIIYSAASNGLIMCISEYGHIQIESKISKNYDKNDPALIDNTQYNIRQSPISGCGNCEDMELSQAGLIRSSTQRHKLHYQTLSVANIKGSGEYVFNDDLSCHLNENHDFTPGQTQSIISTTILIC